MNTSSAIAPVSPPALPDPGTRPLEFLRALHGVAVARALPSCNTAAFLPAPPGGRTVVIGAGKAGGAMAQAVDALWPADAPLSGLVVTRYGHTPPGQPTERGGADGPPARVEIVEAAHPVPDAAGLAAAQRMLELVANLGADDLVLCLISGGGSSLLTLPCEGLSLAQKQSINRQLLACGAGIGEMNTVRKHLSQIKGGRLRLACGAAQVVTLLISDVPGDEVGVIASGPTLVDASTCADALRILQRYSIAVPADVEQALRSGSLETPKPGDTRFIADRVHMTATPAMSLAAAASAARHAGLRAYVLSDEIEGESREVGKVHAALARAAASDRADENASPFQRPCVILSGGETTVTLRARGPDQARGRGGRAGEFCMGLAMGLAGMPGIWGLAADTDGIDGIEDNAGACVAPDTLARAAAAGVSLADCLDRNDAVGFFEPLGDLVVTGPTFTNVNDFRAILVL